MRNLFKFGLPVMLALAAAASPAMARDHDRGHGNDNDQGRGHSAYQGRGNDNRSNGDRGYRDHGNSYRGNGRDYGRDRGNRLSYRYVSPRPVYSRGYGYRPSYHQAYRPVYRSVYRPQRWTRGARYYGPGYGPTYFVNDYGHYGLRLPRPWERWVRYGDDLLLVNLRTGRVVDVIHYRYW